MFTVATIVLLASLVIWVMGDLVFHDKTGTYARYFHYSFIASLILFAIAILLKIGNKLFQPFLKNKCARCNTTIPKGHMYCSTHERKILDETRDKLEETWSKKGMK